MQPPLKDIQAAFKRHLMLHDDSDNTGCKIVEHIVDTGRLAGSARLAIYGNAYYARLIEALEQDYEALHVLLGDEEFTRLCEGYIKTYPSRSPSLRWFGRHMGGYLGQQQPYRNYAYLKELAEFEWTFIETFDAEDAPVVSQDAAARVPAECWPELAITLHPSVHWFRYYWNILPLWKAASKDGEMPDPVELRDGEVCIVWRQGLMTQYRTLDGDEVIFVNGVQAGKNFAELCEALAEQGTAAEEVALRAAGILKTWLASGMISQLHY